MAVPPGRPRGGLAGDRGQRPAVLHLRRHQYDFAAAGAVWLASLFPRDRGASGRREGCARGAGLEPAPGGLVQDRLIICVLIFLFALGVRVYRIGDWTTGMHGDEGRGRF